MSDLTQEVIARLRQMRAAAEAAPLYSDERKDAHADLDFEIDRWLPALLDAAEKAGES